MAEDGRKRRRFREGSKQQQKEQQKYASVFGSSKTGQIWRGLGGGCVRMGEGVQDETGGDRRKVGLEEDIKGPERDQREHEINYKEGGSRIVWMEGGRKGLGIIGDKRQQKERVVGGKPTRMN